MVILASEPDPMLKGFGLAFFSGARCGYKPPRLKQIKQSYSQTSLSFFFICGMYIKTGSLTHSYYSSVKSEVGGREFKREKMDLAQT